jgi:hypothetical protein
MSFSKNAIPDWLSYILSILELLIVIALAGLLGVAVYGLLSGHGQERFTGLMKTIHENWRAALVLLIPLFYRPVRTFLENIEEAGSFKRAKIFPESKQEQTNPAGKI